MNRFLRLAWWSTAVLIVALAVALSAARLLLPGMSEYRVQIETVARQIIKRPVDIGSLDAAWRGLSPVLKLERVVIKDPRFPSGELAIDEVQIALDTLESLTYRQWRTAGIKLIGIDLSLETNLSDREPVELNLDALDWLFRQHSISIEELQLDWTDPGLFEQTLRVAELSMQLVNEGDRHQLLLESDLPEVLGKTLKVAVDINGRGNDPRSWQGKAYLKTERLNLDVVDRVLAEAPIVASGNMDLELWAGIGNQRLEWGSGSLTLYEALFQNATPDAQGFTADRIRSSFYWKAGPSGWNAGLKGLELKRDYRIVWPASDINLAIETASSATTVQGSSTLLVLEELHTMLPLLPWVDADALTMLDRMQPEGRLRDAEFEFRYVKETEPRFSLRAKIEDLALVASAGLPGVSGLSGSVEGNLQSGYLRLDASDANLDLPKVFPKTLALSQLDGVVHWQRYADSFRLESRQLRAASGPVGMLVRWQLDWPYAQLSPWLDLQLALDDLPLTEVGDHLPERVMSPRAVAWLKRAFLAGTATNIRFLLQGQLDQLPFDAGQGRLEARFDFDNVVLDYHPTWGQLDELDGHALFAGRSMKITGNTARILESPVKRVVAVINDFKKPLLEIEGTVGGTLSGMLAYVNASPLGTRFGRLVQQIDSVGDARLQLDLAVPLKQGMGQISVKGDVALDGNDLIPKAEDISLKDIKGTLHFSQDGISADNIQARMLGHPVVVAVYRQGKEGDSQTVLDIAGKLELARLFKDSKFILAPYIHGESQWRSLLYVQNQQRTGQPGVELELRSDLKGIEINLPEPFNKPDDQVREFRLKWLPGQKVPQPVHVVYGDLADARAVLTTDRKGIRKAAIHFGGGTALLPKQDSIHLSGHLERLDLGGWISVFNKPAAAREARAPPLTVDMAVDKFILAGVEVENIQAESRVSDPWYFLVNGEGASGWVRWVFADKARPAQVMANLEHLELNSVATANETLHKDKVKPAAFPKMDIHVGNLRWGQRQLGEIKLVAKRTRQGLDFETLNMNTEAIVFTGRAAWRDIEGRQSTQFSASVQDGELGKLVELLGTGSTVKGGKLDGEIRLNWQDSPAAFSLTTLEADIDLRAKDGRLVSVDEGAGKLLSLFSLNSLQRRLSLDFSDVFKEGFVFDKMEGHFVVMDGDAFTNDFTIKGTSATIEIAGRTGLIAQDYDQLVTVIPQVSSTLPIAGTIAGGPAVGAAVFLADKLVGDKLNRMTRVRYQVSGSWDEPVYKKLERKNGEPAGIGIDTDEQ